MSEHIKKERFGKTSDGKPVHLYRLTNTNNMSAGILDYGGIVVSLKVPGNNGSCTDVVLGFDSVQGYENNNLYFGCIVGRFANRIANARFLLNDNEYKLAQNIKPNHLHGGTRGFDKVIWAAKEISDTQGTGLRLSYLSLDGEEGYPGNLAVKVTYRLTDANELHIEYFAETDQDTVVNLTNHSYFNLSGHDSGDILNHVLTIHAEEFTATDARSIPTGEIKSLANTPLDFRDPVPVGDRIHDQYDALKYGNGYDTNYVLNNAQGMLIKAAEVFDPKSGLSMEALTTQPGVQFYTGNYIECNTPGKGGQTTYQKRSGLCLETQHYPDSPNQPHFPSVVLKPEDSYRHKTVYRFKIK